ncbi:BLUF domain-containing protein [Hymenobacter properus]|uniref:BLUF domain-containing protein n=1 Tax=Hymenobacter properus TaxID=2791026 RepID=A0A931FIY1_9BACT|nr:BLUF domain-containing protein [Hymenobacter properus]MBF9141283.1 BLUF domain-containing protein [Hymenobacter properus]MBR7720093.1 BLUF domain-containing protein [Microvirga sp. SRT04]
MPESSPLFSLVYRSEASRAVHEVTLGALVRKARLYNQQARITGMLLYAKGQFLQLLEGPEPALSDLYARINDDARHYDVTTLSYGPVELRSFGRWPMAYASVDAAFLEKVARCLPKPAAVGLTAEPCPEVALLLRDFAKEQEQAQ